MGREHLFEIVAQSGVFQPIAARNDADVLEYLARVVDGARLEFFAMRRRTDKTSANGICVVEAAVRELLAHVRVDEL